MSLLSARIKGRSKCYATHCGEYGRLRTWNIYNAGKTLYKDRNRVKDFFFYIWKTNNKPCQIMQRLKLRSCIRNILLVCVIYFSLCYALPAS